MVKVVSGDIGFDITLLNFSDLFNGVSYVEKPKLFAVTYASGGTDRFTGSGFEYNKKGVPTDGTITHYDASIGGSVVVSVDKFKGDVLDFVDVARTAGLKDDHQLISKIMKGDDVFWGGNGNDVMSGFGGDDVLSGGDGDDILFGSSGRDILSGGLGSDGLVGGAGVDLYGFSEVAHSTLASLDLISGFQPLLDFIDVSFIDANSNIAGDQAFTWVGDAANATGGGGEIGFQIDSGSTYVVADIDGDLNIDFAVEIDGVFSLTGQEFIL